MASIPLTESYFNGSPKVLDTLIHTWSIHGYSDFLFDSVNRKQLIISDKFKSRRDDQLQFQLRLYPKGHTDTENGYNSVYLIYSIVNRIDITVKFVLAIIDENGEKRFCKSKFL